MNRFIVLSLGVLMLSITAAAQVQEESWDTLRTLRFGQKIQVVDQKLKSQEGTFVGFSDEAISLRVSQDEVAVQRVDVLRVTSLKGMGRGKHTLIGLAVGGVGGLAVGLALGSLFTEPNEGLKDPAFLPAFIGLGAGIGAGIGAALPAGRTTIYRAASP
ncbi:MAG: hypothetical protein HY651_11575 [Acidobacteria bacterium]|nr:hypothetical protein [Acidobacteriota bacterium]